MGKADAHGVLRSHARHGGGQCVALRAELRGHRGGGGHGCHFVRVLIGLRQDTAGRLPDEALHLSQVGRVGQLCGRCDVGDLAIVRAMPGMPTLNTLARPPSLLFAPMAIELLPVELAPRPIATPPSGPVELATLLAPIAMLPRAPPEVPALPRMAMSAVLGLIPKLSPFHVIPARPLIATLPFAAPVGGAPSVPELMAMLCDCAFAPPPRAVAPYPSPPAVAPCPTAVDATPPFAPLPTAMPPPVAVLFTPTAVLNGPDAVAAGPTAVVPMPNAVESLPAARVP